MTYQTNNADPYLAQVAIETSAPASRTYNAFEPSTDTIKGASDSMTIGYRRYKETVTNPANPGQDESQSRNCIGGPANNSDDKRLESIFRYNPATATLSCSGNDPAASPQPIIQNVKDFTIQYLTQATDGTPSAAPTYQYVSATTAGSGWLKVYAVQVCLELEGTERIDTAGAKYIKCDGSEVDRGNKLRMVFRNTYHIRNHAWPTSS